MILQRLIISGVQILAILIMSACAAYIASSSFVFQRWLEQPLLDTLGLTSAATGWALFGVFAAEGLILSFLGRLPGLYALSLSLFLLPSLYAHSSLAWLEFAGFGVEPTLSKPAVGALGVALVTCYLAIRMSKWIGNTEQDYLLRNAEASDVRSLFYFSTGLLLATLSLAATLGLVLALSVESTGEHLSNFFGAIPLGVLTIGVTSVTLVAWATGRLITSQSLLTSDLWRWRR